MMATRPVPAVILALVLAISHRASAQGTDRFDHWQHRRLFPSCTSCHRGVEQEQQPLWPSGASCATCHDGTIQRAVDWSPPADLPRTNLRFTHRDHAEEIQRRSPGRDSTIWCQSCHSEGTERMQVRLAVVQRCLDCHGIKAQHLAAADTACATCHVALAQATRLTRADVGRFPVPDSHRQPGFTGVEHGREARATLGSKGVSAACATCHARDFCTECHVNAPEVPVIQALEPDPRSLALRTELRAPPSHADPEFLRHHGSAVGKAAGNCVTCHTQESCLTCHIASPSRMQSLPVAGPGRGKGAVVRRERPASHGTDFSEIHGPTASAKPETCNGCHARPQCLDCHRPNPADPTPGYHPAGFLSRHPAAAYTRETSCSDCHNTGQFCADCHVKAGLTAQGPLKRGYHDAKQYFLLNHGQAARQNLESCVACHAERDCLTCHSAMTRRFNPHGPGFDPETLKRKNSQACTVCHGAAIPSSTNP
jgi:doubled CXXCH motif protein